MKLTRDQWIAQHPCENPDFQTFAGPLWTLTPAQHAALERQENANVRRDEMRSEARAGIW